MRKTVLIVCLLFLLSAVASPTPLIELREDSASFQLYRLDRGIGADRFSLKLSDKIWKVEGNIAIESKGFPSQIYTELNFKQESFEFASFQQELWFMNLPHKLAMVKKGSKVTIESHSGTTSMNREFKIPGLFSVVEPLAPELLYFSLALMDNTKGWQKIKAIIPSERRQIEGLAVNQGKHPVELKGEYFEADRVFFSFDDLGVVVWIHDDLILRVDIPSSGFRAERRNYEGPRAEQAPTKRKRPNLSEREVEFASADGTKLAGTLAFPTDHAAPLPSVLFISDYGRIDRDGNVEDSFLNQGFLELLDQIAASGFAVLRTDHRGVGKSEGNFATESFSVRLADSRKALEFLAAQPETDPEKLTVMGHGEGANIALRLASEPKVSCAVLLAPSAIALDELALLQTRDRAKRHGLSEGDVEKFSPVPTLIKLARTTNKEWETLGGRLVYLKTYRDWGKVKPLEDLNRIKHPVLICQATRDLQIFRSNAGLFEKPCSKNKLCEFKWFTGLDHFFVPSQGTLGEYANPERTIDKKLTSTVIDWLKER